MRVRAAVGLAGKNEKKKKKHHRKKNDQKERKKPPSCPLACPCPTPHPEATHDPASSERLKTIPRKRAAREGGARGGGAGDGKMAASTTSNTHVLWCSYRWYPSTLPQYLWKSVGLDSGWLKPLTLSPTQPPSVGTRVYLKSVASRRRRSMCVALNLNGPSACTRLLKSASRL